MKVEVTLDEATLRAISYLKCPCTGRQLEPSEVIQTLADDLGMTNSRAGCWEASNMQQVIEGHGWEYNLASGE